MIKEYMPNFNNLEIEIFPKKLADLLQANLKKIDEILLSFASKASQPAVTSTWDNLILSRLLSTC